MQKAQDNIAHAVRAAAYCRLYTHTHTHKKDKEEDEGRTGIGWSMEDVR